MKVQLPEGPVCYLSETDSLISRSIRETGAWEWKQGTVLQRELRNTDTFLDLGAHLGYFSLLAAPLCERVVAVEPQQSMLALFQESARENGFMNVEFVAGVVGFGKEPILLSLATPNTGSTFVGDDGNWPVIEVEGVVLSEVLPDGADVIKSDIEGAEGRLFDSEPWLLKRPRAIFFEYSPALLLRYGDDHVFRSLRDAGFIIFHTNGEMITGDLMLPNKDARWNLVAIKEEMYG